MTAGVFVLRVLQMRSTTEPSIGGALLTATLFAGIVAAVASGWFAASPIDDTWRRAVVAAISVLGAALVAVGATAADQFGGVIGLGMYLTVLIVGAIALHSKARRLARP